MKQFIIGILLISSLMLSMPQTGLCIADYNSKLVCSNDDDGVKLVEAFSFNYSNDLNSHIDFYFIHSDEILIFCPRNEPYTGSFSMVKNAKQAINANIRGPTFLGRCTYT